MASYSFSSVLSSLRRNKNTILFLSLLFLFLPPAVPGQAEELVITPGVLARFGWDDNMFLKDVEDGEFAAEPNLSVSYGSERTKLNVKGTASDYRYLEHDEYDRTTYRTSAGLTHQATERLSFGVDGGWYRDYSLDTFWDDHMDKRTMLRRDTYNAAGNVSYQLTEVDTIDLSFSWAAMEYVQRQANYSDYDMLNASMTWQHSFNDGTMALIAQASWQHVEFDSPMVDYWIYGTVKQDIAQDVYSGMLGLYWAPTQRLTIQAMAGANYTESENQTKNEGSWFAPDSKNISYYYSTGFTGSVDITYRHEKGILRFKIGQEFLPSTYGELRRTTNIQLSGTYEYTKRASLFGMISYNISKSDSISNNEISRDLLHITAMNTYQLTKDFSLRMRYTYIYYNNKVDDATAHSNAFMLQFMYNFPVHY